MDRLTEIIKDYISENKIMFFSYIFICCLGYFVRVIVAPIFYSKFFKEKNEFIPIIKQVCLVWIFLSIIYIIWTRLQYKVVPDFLAYIRTRIIQDYITMNETDFNDSDFSSDVNNILEMTRSIRDLFLFGCETLIPILFLIVALNIFFLFQYPLIGIINLVGNTINVLFGINSYKNLLKMSNIRLENYLKLAGKMDENFNNLFNMYINNKTTDFMNEHKEIEKEYYDSHHEQMLAVENMACKIRYNNYIFAFISLFSLYKKYSKLDFIKNLFIYSFYLSAIENSAEYVPLIISTYGNVVKTYQKFIKSTPLTKLSRPTYQYNLENFQGNIKFDNISFKYPNTENYTIKNFSLEIEPKTKVVIVAQSGAGKSTLMKLILGFYKLDEGNILLDGLNIKEIDPISIREKINYVNQKTLLLKDTIMNNIKYGNNKSDQEIITILNQYDLLKIFNPPENNPESCLQNMVNKNGNNLSLGMQKVIFLIRGILKDAVVFIFDEPLTSIDPNTRENVIKMIKEKTEGKTVIIITHDMEITKIADKIVDFDEMNYEEL